MTPSPQDHKALLEVGQRIRKARLAKEISLRKFAEMVELSPSFYSKLERGDVVAGPDTYARICHRLGLDKAEILTAIGKVDPEIEDVIRKRQVEAHGLLRSLGNLSPEDIEKLTQQARRMEKKHGQKEE